MRALIDESTMHDVQLMHLLVVYFCARMTSDGPLPSASDRPRCYPRVCASSMRVRTLTPPPWRRRCRHHRRPTAPTAAAAATA
jgi:hypothetical protein